MMRDPATIKDSNRFLLVKLTNDGQEITLAVKVSDLYLVGYCCGIYDQKKKKKESWFFDGTVPQEKDLLFKDTVKRDLGFGGNYDSLPNRAIDLGRKPMATTIENLAKTEYGKDMKDVKTAALVLIQMVCEATRYKYISDKVAAAVAAPVEDYNKQFKPDTLMISYQNNWAKLSEAVATSVGDGVFGKQVELKDNSGKLLKTVTKVSQIKGVLSLLKFVKTKKVMA